MRKIKSLSESGFIKLLFGYVTAALLLMSLLVSDRSTMFAGLWQIIVQPSKATTNYFAVGGFSATFLNMGLCALLWFGLYMLCGTKCNKISVVAFFLALGFTSWGINVMNMWPTIFGTVVYCFVKKEHFGSNVNAMVFSTGIAPLITDLMVRYPYDHYVGFHFPGFVLCILVGIFIGFITPSLLVYSPNVHKGYSLYNASFPIGVVAFFLQAVLYKSVGIPVPPATDPAGLAVASRMYVNLFCLVLFGICVIVGLLMGATPKRYWEMLMDDDKAAGVTEYYGNAVFAMNVGIYGLFILGYYNLVGATFNAVTMGVIFCMLCCCNSMSNPRTVLPIIVGYAIGAAGFGFIAHSYGTSFSGALYAQPIVVGLCFANGLSPITRKYGFVHAVFAGLIHYIMVTTVPALHGGFCLYNGGLTDAFVCMLMIPILERFAKTKAEKTAA